MDRGGPRGGALISISELFAMERFKVYTHPHKALVGCSNPMVIEMVKLNESQNKRKS